MTQTSADRIRASFQLIAPKASEVIESFYATLFAAAPAVRAMFPEDMKQQKAHLLAAVGLVVKHADNLGALREPLLAMGQRHAGYGAHPTHYAAVREVLERFVAEGPTEAELQAAKANMIGGFPLLIDSNRKLLATVANMAWNGLPMDYLDTWTQQVDQLSVADVRAAFSRKLQPQRMVTVVLGAEKTPQ